LFATLAGIFISIATKEVRGTSCWRESNWVGWEALIEFEGLPGGQTNGKASTEELRQAMIHYRTLFDELVGTPELARAQAAS
jgi:hypothetical protein